MLLALILVVPLMIDRVRVLEDTRSKQVAQAANELSELAKHTADAQREVISTVQAVLKSSAYIYAAASQQGRGCAIMRASLRVDLPWIRSLSILGSDGKIQCSTTPSIVAFGFPACARPKTTHARQSAAATARVRLSAPRVNPSARFVRW